MTWAQDGAKKALPAIAVAMSIFQMMTVDYRFVHHSTKLIVFVGFALTISALRFNFSGGHGEEKRPGLDQMLMAILMVAITSYSYLNFYSSLERVGLEKSATELMLGALLLLVILELCRRRAGWPLTIVMSVVFIYALYANHFPGIFNQRAISLERLIGRLFLTTEGVYGGIVSVAATYVFIFALFGGFLLQSGAGDYFIKLAFSIMGGSRGGPAKIAVLASSLFAMISGSALSNISSTGQFTIPIMKRIGYKREFAAAVEAVASLGGEITPPIMVGSVFIMMEFLSLPYSTIIKAAALIALLYYIGIYVSVDLVAARQGLKGMPPEEIPPLWETVKSGYYYLIPPIFLVVLLVVFQYPPERAGLYGTLSIPVVMLFTRNRMGFRSIYAALMNGAFTGAGIAIMVIAASILTGIINVTGISLTFSERIVALADNSYFLLLVMSMVTAIILGMGLPSVTSYVIMAVLLAPALIKLGASPLTAHMFVLYAAMSSLITPPVCTGVMVASGIAESNWLKTSFESMKLAKVLFVIPFMFAYSPLLLMQGPPLQIAAAVLTAVGGVITLTIGMEGYFFHHCRWYERILFVAAGLALIYPSIYLSLAGAAAFGMGLLLHMSGRPATTATRQAPASGE